MKIEVVHDRGPDYACGLSYYIDGEPSHLFHDVEIEEYSLDAGAGYEFACGWVEQAYYTKKSASPAVWARLEESYVEPGGKEYIEGWPDWDGESEWADHLDEDPHGDSAWWTAYWRRYENGGVA